MGTVLSPVLVGRDDQVAELRAFLDGARQGHGGVRVLVGEPGVGKSRLARETRTMARVVGLTTLAGRATPDGGPLGPLTSALLAHGRRYRISGSPELEPFRPALGLVVPEWAGAASSPATSIPVLAEGLLRLLRTIAPQGALLLLEDLHWASLETLAVLDYLADAVGDEPFACLLTTRPDQRSPMWNWLAEATARRVAGLVDVPRLTADQSLELVRACLGGGDVPPELRSFIAEHAEGLPLLVEDLLADLVTSGTLVRRGGAWTVRGVLRADVPRTFAATVHRQLAALDQVAQRVASGAAVLGRRFDWTLLADVTGCDEQTVLTALRSAVDHQIITSDEAGPSQAFCFRHTLTRDVVLDRLLAPERAALARSAADALEARHPGLPGEECGLAAALHAAGGRPRRSAELYLELGRRALAAGALTTAEATLRRARTAVDDPAWADVVDVTLIEVLALAGRVDEALALGETVLGRLSAAGDDARRTTVELRLARAAAVAGQEQRACRHLVAVLASADEEQVIRAAALQALVALDGGHPAEAERGASCVLIRAEQAGLWDVVCETLQVLGRCARLRNPAEAERLFERAHRIGQEHGLELERIRALQELGIVDLFETGRTDRLDAARRLALRAGALVTVAQVDLHRGLLLAHAGRTDAGRQAMEDCVATAAMLRLPGLRRVAQAQLGYVLAVAGRRHHAEDLVTEVLDEPTDDDARLVVTGLTRPFLHLLSDDRAAAVAALDDVAGNLTNGSWPQWGVRALLHAVEGTGRAAVAEAERVAAPGRPVRLNAAYLGFARAVLAGRDGDRRAAAAAFDEADRLLGWQVAHRPLIWRHVAERAVEDGWGDPVRWLREVLPVFEERGARPVVASCRSLLARSGVPVPRRGRGDTAVPPALSGLGVTSREADVLALLVGGASNPEIAERLHLSRRTVETHVAQLLAKTGERRREALRRFADSVRPPP